MKWLSQASPKRLFQVRIPAGLPKKNTYMAHIHELIDFTVGMYIVYEGKVLFIHHKKQNMWLPIGGHIELDEDPEQALFREIEEETGLTKNDIEILSEKPNFASPAQKYLYTPNLLDIHTINDIHKHIGLLYFIRAKTNEVRLEADAHNDIRWLSKEALHDSKYQIRDDIIYAAEKAIDLDKNFK